MKEKEIKIMVLLLDKDIHNETNKNANCATNHRMEGTSAFSKIQLQLF